MYSLIFCLTPILNNAHPHHYFFLILHEIFFKKHKKYFLFAPTSYIALIYLNDASKGKRIGCSSSVWILFLAFLTFLCQNSSIIRYEKHSYYC